MNPKVISYAIESHNKVNHLYNGVPYSVHLAMVVAYAYEFLDIIPDISNHHKEVIDACWLHDTIEDCRLTYNDIKDVAGENVANMVYAVTNEKGKTRAERAGDNYYKGIRNTMWASFIKLCDRLANVHYSKITGSRMLGMYQKENPHFIEQLLLDRHYKPMVDKLNQLLNP